MIRTLKPYWILILCSVYLTANAIEEDDCPYLPEFKPLREKLSAMQPKEVVRALEQYKKHSEGAELCESIEINSLLNEQEKSLFFLHAGAMRLPAQFVMRCNEVISETATCQGPYMDSTFHVDPRVPPLAVPSTGVAVVSNFPAAQPVGIYRWFIHEMSDGKPATRLKLKKGLVSLPKDAKDFVLIAIYKTRGPWAYRKVVWYF